MIRHSHLPAASDLRLARGAVSLHFFLTGLLFASWATRIPTIQARLALSTGELGLALFSIAVGELAAMYVAGYLAARFGSQVITTIASAGLSALLPILALAPNLPPLMAALLLFGASFGAVNVAMNTQAVAIERRYGRPILNSFHACYSLGALTGALTSGIVASHDIALVPHFVSLGLLGLALTLGVSRFLLPARMETQKGVAALVRPNRALLVLGLIAFCVLLGEGSMADWSAVYLSGTIRTGAGLAAAGYAAFSIVMAAGRGLGDRLTNRFGPRFLVRMGGVLAACGLTLALVVSWVPLVLLGFGLVGAGFSVIFPLTLSAAGRISQQAAGTAVATVAACGYVGFLVGPPVIGFAAEALTLRVALGVVVVLSLCAAVCGRAIMQEQPSQQGMNSEGISLPGNQRSLG